MIKGAVIFIFLLILGCGKGFKTKENPYLEKVIEIEDAKQKENRGANNEDNQGTAQENPDKPLIADSGEVIRKEKWTQDLPQKYDDVGDFYRVKEIPGMSENEVLDSVQTLNPEQVQGSKTVQLFRGKLKLSQVKHRFIVSSNKNEEVRELEVTGDVTFNNQSTYPFVLKGKATDFEFPLEIADKNSNLKNVFKAKAICLKEPTENSSIGDSKASNMNDECDKLAIDFYYKNKDVFYTDQLISKSFITAEIQHPVEEFVVPNEFFNGIPEEELTDYDKKQKKGKHEEPPSTEDIANPELPSYFINPNLEDVSALYPEVKKTIDDAKIEKIKVPKKLKVLPELTGDEKIPEGPDLIGPPPAMDLNPVLPKSPPHVKSPMPKKEEAIPKAENAKKEISKTDTSKAENPKVESPKKETTLPDIKPGKPTTPEAKPESKPKQPVVGGPPASRPPANPSNPSNPASSANPASPAKPGAAVVEAAANDHRPKDQAWGKPHTGKYIKSQQRTIYLTQSNSLLEAFQKIGPNSGFSVWSPKKLRHYGTYDIVESIVNLGEWIKDNIPSFTLKVNDMSGKNGGNIGHSSHKTGMDVDLSYVTKNPKMAFMDMDRVKGALPHPEFQGAEQWKLFKAAFDLAPVEVIYVNRKIKNEMCRQALLSKDLPSNTDTKSEAARMLTRLVVIDNNHGDHWHLRMDCKTLNFMKVQRNCISQPQPFVGPECQKISLK